MPARIAVFLLLLASLVFSQSNPSGVEPSRMDRRQALQNLARILAERGPEPFLRLWRSLTEDERRAFLARLPEERRTALQQRIDQLSNLTEQQREELQERFDFFRAMPANQQETARQIFRRYLRLPPARRALLMKAMDELRPLSEGERRSLLESEEYNRRFVPFEARILADYAALPAAPPRP
jgi:hypothetical protein